jgi:GNAT superfamily N-acetyltransferase
MGNATLTARQANKEDTGAITQLMNELGYATTLAEMTQRLETIFQHSDYATWVACHEGVVVGMAGASRNYYYERNGSYVRIVALVAHTHYRKMGVGKTLLRAVEDWARQLGATTLILNCGNREERKAAHQFYRNQGFEPKSTGYAKGL